VYNPLTREFESPHRKEDLKFCPGAMAALKQLSRAGYLLLLVSNQPSFAKGKTSLENIHAVHDKLHRSFVRQGIAFAEYFYCYHHPQGIIPGYRRACRCRKPKPYFLLHAKKKYRLNMRASWMIGDSDSDIACGLSAGVKTIAINERRSRQRRGNVIPDFCVNTLKEAAELVLQEKSDEKPS
jgi:D-glycero-D-manno-heptose 1,7-bisphosphate phosphatase